MTEQIDACKQLVDSNPSACLAYEAPGELSDRTASSDEAAAARGGMLAGPDAALISAPINDRCSVTFIVASSAVRPPHPASEHHGWSTGRSA